MPKPTTTTWNEAACAKNLPLFWPVQQSGAAVKHNDNILTNLMTSHCFNPIPWPISSLGSGTVKKIPENKTDLSYFISILREIQVDH